MSVFLEKLSEYICEVNAGNVIRISEICGDCEPETKELRQGAFCQNTYSVAKTFTMAAIGILFDKGLVKPDDKICDILKDEIPDGIDQRWFDSTVDMALTHRLGLPGGFLDIDAQDSLTFSEDYLSYLFNYPLDYEPGTQSKYSDGAFYLLARIAEKLSGLPLEDFLRKEMLNDMQFREIAWSHCPQGHAMGATGLYINSSDCVKFGKMLLDCGVYKGKRYLSEEWVKLAFNRGYALDHSDDYKLYFKGGMFGQKLIIVPSQNRAVAVQSFGANTDVIACWIKEYKG